MGACPSTRFPQQNPFKPHEGPREDKRNCKTQRQEEGKHENRIGETPSNERQSADGGNADADAEGAGSRAPRPLQTHPLPLQHVAHGQASQEAQNG